MDSHTTNSQLEPIELVDGGNIRLKYANIVVEPVRHWANTAELLRHFDCTATSTLIEQLARLFISIVSDSALLLVGPPGVGKTAVVHQVCKLLGAECERINFSSSTTLEQLFGSIMPQQTPLQGRREFQWRDGKLTKAIKSGKWLLLDEINLATSDVLQELSVLLVRNAECFCVPGSGEEVCVKNTRIFATLNPASTGGGRHKLPRSIENLFVSVKLDEYNTDELFVIVLDLFDDAIKQNFISIELVQKLYALHLAVKEKYKQREIGRCGGPYEFNLRELVKFRDILVNNAEDQIFYYKFSAPLTDLAGESTVSLG